MAGDYVLDTNIVIALLKGEEGVASRAASALSVWIPFPVLGELHYGARNSAHPEENVARVEQIAAHSSVLFPDLATVREYGVVRSRLRAIGRPIPEADLWIAALTIQHGLVLVSRDTHFEDVSRLQLERW